MMIHGMIQGKKAGIGSKGLQRQAGNKRVSS